MYFQPWQGVGDYELFITLTENEMKRLSSFYHVDWTMFTTNPARHLDDDYFCFASLTRKKFALIPFLSIAFGGMYTNLPMEKIKLGIVIDYQGKLPTHFDIAHNRVVINPFEFAMEEFQFSANRSYDEDQKETLQNLASMVAFESKRSEKWMNPVRFANGEYIVYSSRLSEEWTVVRRFRNGENVNLKTVMNALQKQCDMVGIPVSFCAGTLKMGIFKNDKQFEDILIMTNPQHKDYLSFALRLTHTGKFAFLHVYNLGGSKNPEHNNPRSISRRFDLYADPHSEEYYYEVLKVCIESIEDTDVTGNE